MSKEIRDINLIFVIDDEQAVCEEIKEIISRAVPFATIETFGRGYDALDAITGGRVPDVVFSDIEMPGISGLEFAARLKGLALNTRIIFVTADEKYAVKAFKVKAHGYLIKPITVEDVEDELGYLPSIRSGGTDKLEVKCFGHFDVYWKGEPVIFKRKQSKELLAYLIDREGAACNSREIAAALWKEDDNTKAEQNRIRVLVNDLKNTLKDIGMEDLLMRQHRELAIRKDMINCDYYRMLEGDMDAVNSYSGEYMIDYSWAELTNAKLYFGGNRNRRLE